jgi:hypothetical protein
VTCRAPVSFDRGVFINERTLFVCVTLDACGISPRGKTSLLQLKSTMRVMTVAAAHRAFEDFVVKRQVELMFGFRMATYAQLRLIHLQQLDR